MNIDLPNLTSIIYSPRPMNNHMDFGETMDSSFFYPRYLLMESISEYRTLMIFRYTKTAKGRATLVIQESSKLH